MRVRYAVAATVVAAGFAIAAIVVAAIVYSGGGGSKQAAGASAPRFTAADLTRLPTTDWITNGGSVFNQRYSPLTQIDAANVSRLKGVWHVHLRGSATAAKYSGESQPIAYKGMLYIPTGEDDVFAIDARTGKIRWQYKGNLDQQISTVCCGWESRGVALGDGKLYLGKLNGSVVALDQKTGKEVWKTALEPWQKGYSIPAAPLYYDGRVYVGISGGEFLARGRVTALDARTGKELWRFYTIPGPGETGHDTWPSKGDAWQHGGAPVWQTPAVDPKLGLVYFSTGNAAPDLNGHDRAGDNLFTSSIVAIDAKTGKYRWHFQEVHHDIWDYDAPSPVVLFDVKVHGKLRHGLGQPGKTGWLYLLDRSNGKPLYPIPEKSVPQDAYQHTAKTQPFPSYAPFVSHSVTQKEYQAVAKAAAQQAKGEQVPKVVKAPQIFTPVTKTITVMTPAAQGGDNWPPSSYNRRTEMFYVCGQDGFGGYSVEQVLTKTLGTKQAQQAVLGGALLLPTGFGQNIGTLTAIDARSGKTVWQNRFPESCYSGTVTTAGNLVFVGRNGGELEAYDARNGHKLWHFQTGAGANDTPTVFQLDGQEVLAFYAGGSALAASPHGDDVWLFSLRGKLGPAKPPGAGQGVQHAGEAPAKKNTAGDANAGKTVFAQNCATCHGATGHGGNGGPDLTSIPSAKQVSVVVGQVENGGGGMPPFKGTLSQKQINDVAAYVTQKITNAK